jgi:hypothetical protein
MAYTAPSGNAVDFVFNGLAYSAPLGNAVNFSFAPDGAVTWAFEPDFSAFGVVGFTASYNTPLSLSVDIVGKAEPSARADVRLELDLSIVGSAPPSGTVGIQIEFAYSSAGRSTVLGQALVDVFLDPVVVVAASAVGELREPLGIADLIQGVSALAGTTSVPVEFSVSATGIVVPVGEVEPKLRFSVLGAGEHRQPFKGALVAPLSLSASGAGAAGVAGNVSLPVSLTVVGASTHGRIGATSATVELNVSAYARAGVAGAVAIVLEIDMLARQQADNLGAANTFVLLRPESLAVFQ